MGLNRSREGPTDGKAYARWKAQQQAEQRARIDRRRYVSELAVATRRPGQTLQARCRELEQ